MVTTELRILRHGETFLFERRTVVPEVGPMVPPPEYAEVSEQLLRRLVRMVTALDDREAPAGRESILELGRFIDDFILPDETRAALQAMEEAPVLIVTEDPRIPWELAGVTGDGAAATTLAERVPVGRCLAAPGASLRAGRPPAPVSDGHVTRALLIVDPCGQLPDARAEARVLLDYLDGMGWEAEIIVGDDATHDALFDALAGGDWEFIHFCCDVVGHPTGGAVVASDGELTAGTIRCMNFDGSVAYLGACRSALHRPDSATPRQVHPPVAGLAQAFMEAGASGVIGSLWRACDRTSRFFAQRFYRRLTEVAGLGDSLLAARRLAIDPESEEGLEAATLSGFVLYGDPQLRVAVSGAPAPSPESPEEPTTDRAGDEAAAAGVAAWPTAGWFEPDAEAVLTAAARAARDGESIVTSMHLGWALLGEGTPLSDWLRENDYPLEISRELARALVEKHEEDAPQSEVAEAESAPLPAPELSPTLAGIMQWAEGGVEAHPISLAALTEHFCADGGGIMGELLETLGVSLAGFPEPRARVPRSTGVREALASAEDTAAMWNEGVTTSSHLLLGVFEAGGGPLAHHLRRLRRDPEEFREELARKIMDGPPDPSVTETTPSFNTSRILLAAEKRAAELGHEEMQLADIIDAAARLGAGGFGAFLQRVGYARRGHGDPVRPDRPPEAPPQIVLSPGADRMLAMAARCMTAAGHGLVGTPHFVSAALRLHPGLQEAVAEEGGEAERALEEILSWIGVPEGVDPFDEQFAVSGYAISPNLTSAAARAREMAGEEGVSVEQLLVAALTQASGRVAVLLQRMGIEPHRLARRLEDPGASRHF